MFQRIRSDLWDLKKQINGDPVVYQLIYTSSTLPEVDDEALREIAQVSSYNNRERDITGLLLYHEGSIMQVLEGDEFNVCALYGKIKKDLRHKGCMILSTRASEQREFSDWFMGYRNLSGRGAGKGLFNLTQGNLAEIMPASPSRELETLTRTYAKVSGF